MFYLVACFIIHELGHFLAALCLGHILRFRFAFGRFFVPRFVWDMPDIGGAKQRIIAAAGFGLELAAGLVCAAVRSQYSLLFFGLIHFAAYPFYAGDDSDFQFFKL